MWADREMSLRLVKRAQVAGFEALIVTVDGVVSPNREYNHRNGYGTPFRFNRKNVTDVLAHPGWMFNVFARYMLTTGMPRRENLPDELRQSIISKPSLLKNDSLNWDDLKALRDMWPGKLMVKGVLHAEDAVRAADCGADAVIVSNHGGRNLDSSRAPIEVLPDIVGAVGHRIPVIVDSGFRRGSDVVKALALGAKAVLIGRSTLYGTAVAGQEGAAYAIDIFRKEIDRTMAMVGARSVDELKPELLTLT
jgi:isopentenyl diphosphate isomerase/L-lactate dehydrogenase-like FMN-dependent dehydrogenase